MGALRELLQRLSPAGRLALKKRRLEALLRAEGLSRSAARRLVAAYFAETS